MDRREGPGPIVSVIMPAYNAEKYIKTAVESVLNQTMGNLELFIIDDGSTDQTIPIVSEMEKRDSRIKVLINDKNMGVAETRNRGLSLSQGQYVALLDSDDVWHPDKLERQIKLAEETGAQLVYASYALMSEEGDAEYNEYIVPEKTDFGKMLIQNVIGCSTVLFSNEIAKKYKFDETFYHEDYMLWLNLLQDGYRAAGVTECLVDYRVMEDSRSSDKKHSAKKRWLIYRKHLKFSVPKSFYYFAKYAMAGAMKYRKK